MNHERQLIEEVVGLPETPMFLPGCFLSVATSSGSVPRTREAFFQSTLSNVLEHTYFTMLVM